MRKINKREQRGALACTETCCESHAGPHTRLGATGSGQDEVGLPFRPSGGLLTFPAEEDLVRSLDELDEPEAIECGAHTVDARLKVGTCKGRQGKVFANGCQRALT